MNTLQLKMNLLSNSLYEYVLRSPALLVRRIESRLKDKFHLNINLTPPRETHAITWVREESNFHTRLYVFNYWTEHYKVERVPISIEIRNSAGNTIGQIQTELEPRETRIIDARDVLKQIGVSAPFVGSFLLKRTDGGAGTGQLLKLLQEYYGDSFTGAVHEYGTKENFGYKENQMGVVITADDYVDDVEIGLINCNFDPSLSPQKLVINIFKQNGEKFEIDGGRMGPGQSVLFSLNKLMPAWREFIGKQPGNISIHFPCSVGRPLIFHRSKDKTCYSLNHLTGDKSRTPHIIRADAMAGLGVGPIWSAGVLFEDDLTTGISILMNWGFNTSFNISGKVFDKEGKEVGRFEEILKPWETWVYDLKKCVDMSKIQLPFYGSVSINAKNNSFMPYDFDANAEFIASSWRQSVNIGSGVMNLPARMNIRSHQMARTKNFLRIRDDKDVETYFVVVNHSSDPDFDVSSETTFRLISQDGKREASRTIVIPPRGTYYGSAHDLFPEYATVMGGSTIAQLHIRDTKVKLMGIHMLRNKKTNVFSADHYFGG